MIENEKQIDEMIEIVKPFVSGLACGDESGSCELTDCRSCKARNLSKAIIEKDYRKQSEGEWVDQYQGKYVNRLYKCSVCGDTAFHDDKRWFLTPFCSNCGAKMKGGAKMQGGAEK